MTMGIGGLTTGIAAMLPAMIGAAGAFAALGTAITATLASAMAFLGWPVLLAAALGALLVSVNTHREAIAAALLEMFEAVKGAAHAAWESLPLGLREAVASVPEAFGQMAYDITGRFRWLDDKISSMVEGTRSRVQSVLSLLYLCFAELIPSPALAKAGDRMVRGV